MRTYFVSYVYDTRWRSDLRSWAVVRCPDLHTADDIRAMIEVLKTRHANCTDLVPVWWRGLD